MPSQYSKGNLMWKKECWIECINILYMLVGFPTRNVADSLKGTSTMKDGLHIYQLSTLSKL